LLAADPVGARLALTQLIDSRQLNAVDEQAALQAIREVNAKLFFSPTVAAGDIVTKSYTVQSGDTLAKIARRSGVQADWRAIQRINGLKSEKSLRVGQTIKIPVTAFHAEVSKSSYIMRVYAGEGPTRVMIAAFPVGLGEFDSTPTGVFMVRPKSKLINPEWKNPRTGEHFAADDPKNPIGERWIGLLGVEAHNQGFKGIGIHGTVEQDSIGKQASMGCVRMGDRDVELIYELLTEPNSTILIAP
jgi:lipoprotein-anchoring transpeptidase ErfK/SrfK